MPTTNAHAVPVIRIAHKHDESPGDIAGKTR